MIQQRATSTAMNVSGTSSNTVTVTKPAQTADGDLMIAVTVGPVATVTPPAGWTLMGSFTDVTVQSNLYKKIASSEGASYVFTWSSSDAVGAFICSFMGGYDICLWDANTEQTDSTPVTRRAPATRNSIAFSACCWADTATGSVTANQGTEQFDTVSANTGSTVFRGMAGYLFGQPASSDIVNIGDNLPNTTFTLTSAPTGSVNWVLLLGEKADDTESWSSVNGDFAVDLKLDEVAVNSVGSITTNLIADVTGTVSAVTSQGEAGGSDENLKDGLASTRWQDNAATSWVVYDFGASVTKTIRRYRMTSSTESSASDPMDWQFQGSQNASDWTTLDTRTNESFAGRGEVHEYKVPTTGAYRYYRLNVTANKSSGATVSVALAEWRLSTIDVWEDITTFVNEESKIRITRGLQGASGRSDFSRAYVELNNTDGRFSIRNQTGAYYGGLQRNNQMRISKAFGTKSLQLQGDVRIEGTNVCGDAVMCPLTSALSITGDIDIRIDLEPESWRDEQMLCGTSFAGDDALGFGSEGWSLRLDGFGILHLTWHDGGANFFDVSSELAVPQSTRLAVRVTMDVDNGASGKTLKFYTAPTIAGPWEQLGATVTQSGTTSIGYTGSMLSVGHVPNRDFRGVHGLVYHFELRTGIDGTLVTDLDFTTLANGVHSFTDSNSNRWVTVDNAVVSNRRYRFHGEVAEWPVTWDPTGTWIVTSATGAGVQKRLERGNSAPSVMRRYHTKGVITDPGAFERLAEPFAYWPLEDKKGAFELASGLPSKPAMQIYGNPEFEASDGDKFNESDTLIKLNAAKFGGRVTGNPSGYADIRWIHFSPTDMSTGAAVLEFFSTGTLKRWSVTYEATDTWRVRGYNEDDSGSSAWDSGNRTVTTNNKAMHIQLILDESGANISVAMNAYDVFGTSLGSWTDTFTTATFGRIYRININPEGDVSNTYVGHMALYGTDSPTFTDPFNAYHYEAAGTRIERLCKEEQIGFRHIGTLAESTFMGYQDMDTPFSAMSTSAVSDDGFLVDPLDAFGIEYRTSRSLHNQAAHMELSYTGFELSGSLDPVADDSHIVNDFTANRGGAGGARFQRTDGKLSVNAPPDGVGPYEDSQSYSLAHEGQCVDIASWQVHRGTLDEDRYTRIGLALENLRIVADASLAERILLVDVGDRVDITDTPDFLEADDIRQVVIGYQEWFDKFQHNIDLNTLPERVFEVAEYDSWDHFDGDGTTMYQDITSTTTSFDVNPEGLPVAWTSDPEAMPFDIRVDGEVMRVVAPGSLINENPFFDSTVSDWTTQNCSVTRDTTYVHPHPDALASMKITPDGSLGNANALAPEPDVSVTGGNKYLASGWVFTPDGYDSCRITVSWFDSGGTFISTSTVTADSVAANTWTFIEEPVTAPSNAAFSQIVCGQTNSPTGSEVTYWWAVRFTEVTATSESWYTSDTFDRADSTTTPGSTNGGLARTWTEDSGTWGIISNTAYITASADSVMTFNFTAGLEWMEVSVPTWTSGTANLVFRFTDTSNYLRFGGTVATAAILEQVVAGVATTIATADDDQGQFTLAAGDTLAVRCNGSVIECFVNGRMALCVSDTTQESATRVGLRLTTNVPRLNDFYVEAAGPNQTFRVERGRNGAAAYHKSGASIALNQTPFRGL